MSEGARWFAAYVRSRHESRVAEHLAARSVERFLPQYKSRRFWRDRKVELELPLFPGYLFVRIPAQQQARVLTVPGVLYLVSISGRPVAVEDIEIEQLRMATNQQNDPRPHPLMKAGDRVKVTRGPLKGAEGFLVREKNQSRVVLSVDLIQKAMSVEVEMDAIMPAPWSGIHLAHQIARPVRPSFVP